MLITCPHCGKRPVEEFTFLGDAKPVRPSNTEPSSIDQWVDYVYLRDNPRGVFEEFVQHSGGCRSWLVVTRDTSSHEIFSTVMANDYVARRQREKR